EQWCCSAPRPWVWWSRRSIPDCPNEAWARGWQPRRWFWGWAPRSASDWSGAGLVELVQLAAQVPTGGGFEARLATRTEEQALAPEQPGHDHPPPDGEPVGGHVAVLPSDLFDVTVVVGFGRRQDRQIGVEDQGGVVV